MDAKQKEVYNLIIEGKYNEAEEKLDLLEAGDPRAMAGSAGLRWLLSKLKPPSGAVKSAQQGVRNLGTRIRGLFNRKPQVTGVKPNVKPNSARVTTSGGKPVKPVKPPKPPGGGIKPIVKNAAAFTGGALLGYGGSKLLGGGNNDSNDSANNNNTNTTPGGNSNNTPGSDTKSNDNKPLSPADWYWTPPVERRGAGYDGRVSRKDYGNVRSSYELVADYLISEGHADSLDEVNYLIENISDEYMSDILDYMKNENV